LKTLHIILVDQTFQVIYHLSCAVLRKFSADSYRSDLTCGLPQRNLFKQLCAVIHLW